MKRLNIQEYGDTLFCKDEPIIMHTQSNKTKGKPIALVTGGGVRLGADIVQSLSAHFKVAIHCYQSQQAANNLLSQLDEGKVFQSDLTQPSGPQHLIDDVVSSMGSIHLLVNNAALFFNDNSELIDLARMKILNVDVPKRLIATARPHLAAVQGHVINIADIAGIVPFKEYSAYSKSKAALIEHSQQISLELAREQIRINTICPGIVLPQSAQQIDTLDILQQQIPLNRIGRPQDVSSLVSFLATTDFITGQIIAVDGGRLLNYTTHPQ